MTHPRSIRAPSSSEGTLSRAVRAACNASPLHGRTDGRTDGLPSPSFRSLEVQGASERLAKSGFLSAPVPPSLPPSSLLYRRRRRPHRRRRSSLLARKPEIGWMHNVRSLPARF